MYFRFSSGISDCTLTSTAYYLMNAKCLEHCEFVPNCEENYGYADAIVRRLGIY
jgi:hypothetical protein